MCSSENYEPECGIASRENPLCYCYKNWELRLHSAGVAGTATEHCHAYAIFLFLDLVISHERARGEVRYPRWHWMSFRIWLAPNEMVRYYFSCEASPLPG
jgi:hypothetical protein